MTKKERITKICFPEEIGLSTGWFESFESELTGTSDAIELTDSQGYLLWVNPSWRELFDADRVDVRGIRWDRLISEESHMGSLWDSFYRTILEESAQGQLFLSDCGKEGRLVLYMRFLLKNHLGSTSSVMTIYRAPESGTSKYKPTQLLQSLLDQKKEAVVVINKDGAFLACNSIFVQLTGFVPVSNSQFKFSDLVSDGRSRTAPEEPEVWTGEAVLKCRDGEEKRVWMDTSPVVGEYDEVIGYEVRISSLG